MLENLLVMRLKRGNHLIFRYMSITVYNIKRIIKSNLCQNSYTISSKYLASSTTIMSKCDNNKLFTAWFIVITLLLVYNVHFRKKKYRILDSIVVSIPACHAGDRGSIPRRGDFFFEFTLWWLQVFNEIIIKKL